MRIALIGLLAATAVLTTGCGPAVGSPDWCKQFQAKMEANPNALDALSKLTEEEKRGMAQCMEAAFKGALGQ